MSLIEGLCDYEKDWVEGYLIYSGSEWDVEKAKEYLHDIREWGRAGRKAQQLCKPFHDRLEYTKETITGGVDLLLKKLNLPSKTFPLQPPPNEITQSLTPQIHEQLSYLTQESQCWIQTMRVVANLTIFTKFGEQR